MRVYERTNAVVSLTLIGLALYFVLEFPIQATQVNLLGSPLGVDSPRRWLMALLLVGFAMAGTDMVIRAHPALPSRRLDYLVTFWMLPGLLVIAATQLLGLAPTPVTWGIGLLGMGVLLWLTVVAEYHQLSPHTPARYWTHLWRQFVGYVVALALFTLIYQTRSRSAMSATQVLLVSGMVALALLRQPPKLMARTWLFAAVIGLSMGQITWALNYWHARTLSGGLFLLLVFYLLIGLAQQQLLGALSRRTLWEFGMVATLALVVIISL